MINIPSDKELPPEILKRTLEFQRIASRGVRTAQEEARKAGVPNVYSINGILHWELPDGSLTTEDPWEGKDDASKPSTSDA